jgi:hypothetical protein
MTDVDRVPPITASAAPEAIRMPSPSVWPMITAFGLTLLFAGLVTHAAVSIVGLVLALRGAAGWWTDVLPHERHHEVAVSAQEAWPHIPVSRLRVEYLTAGQEDHRVRIPAEIHPYSSGLRGGAVGAVAMAIVAVTYGVIGHGSVWYVVNLLAAGVVPSLAAADMEQLRAFSSIGLVVGTVMHATISALVGVLYAVLLPMFPHRAGLWSGLVTPILWSGLIKASLDVVNPTLNTHIDWTWFVASQIAFGLACGFVVAHSASIETRQSWSWENRAGLEGPRGPGER